MAGKTDVIQPDSTQRFSTPHRRFSKGSSSRESQGLVVLSGSRSPRPISGHPLQDHHCGDSVTAARATEPWFGTYSHDPAATGSALPPSTKRATPQPQQQPSASPLSGDASFW